MEIQAYLRTYGIAAKFDEKLGHFQIKINIASQLKEMYTLLIHGSLQKNFYGHRMLTSPHSTKSWFSLSLLLNFLVEQISPAFG